jgi:hypothetical protein
MGPEFQSAWETLKSSGIGSTDATWHVSNLIRGSRSALRRSTFGQHGVWGLMRIRQGNLIRWRPTRPKKSRNRAHRGSTTEPLFGAGRSGARVVSALKARGRCARRRGYFPITPLTDWNATSLKPRARKNHGKSPRSGGLVGESDGRRPPIETRRCSGGASSPHNSIEHP